jgi:hypothetical protein
MAATVIRPCDIQLGRWRPRSLMKAAHMLEAVASVAGGHVVITGDLARYGREAPRQSPSPAAGSSGRPAPGARSGEP